MIGVVYFPFTNAVCSESVPLRTVTVWARASFSRARALFSQLAQVMDEARRAIIEAMFRRRKAYRDLFFTEEGALKPEAKKVIDHWCREARVLSTAAHWASDNTMDPVATAYHNGMRDMVMITLRELNTPLPDLARILAQEDDVYV